MQGTSQNFHYHFMENNLTKKLQVQSKKILKNIPKKIFSPNHLRVSCRLDTTSYQTRTLSYKHHSKIMKAVKLIQKHNPHTLVKDITICLNMPILAKESSSDSHVI
ncbi:unnamed protein product [Rangifer tarandus platyrhynchus]|uniref:Ribosomal protein S10 n=2 Tax=Rangifer tarandus platyrhynchus TaxID=3082113 RepID=A0ABN8XWJ1_RANTA|nr:unnamed protein product [Rangifer tarandus platyrhynchus]